MSTVGWERLVTISDAELRGSSEDTVDELYAFLLTNKLQPTSELVQQSGHLVKLISTIQTVLRLKDAEFQEILTAYEQNEKQGLSDKQSTEENAQLKRHIYEQEMKIGELEDQARYGVGGAGGGRELTLLRQEVDELRMELGESRRRLDSEKMETEKLKRELSSEHQQSESLRIEIGHKREEVETYRNKLGKQQDSGRRGSGMGLVEEELRERLRVQEREMAEQLDKMEELLRERQKLEDRVIQITEQLGHVEEEKNAVNTEIQKHQEALSEADHTNNELKKALQRTESQMAHLQDQVNQQTDANRQLCDRMKEETDKLKSQLTSRTEELTQSQGKVTQLETQLKLLERDTKKTSAMQLSKQLAEKETELEQLKEDLTQASTDIQSLSKQLQEANKRADPNQVNPVLYQEISDLKAKYQELEGLIDIEQQRRHKSEEEKEECDRQLVEMRGRIEQYERGHVGLREAIAEIKSKKEELAHRDSEVANLIQQVNKLQHQVDILYEINEALRLRLGMGPDDHPDLSEVRERHEAELTQLRERNQSLSQEVERLEEEKLTLRKKFVDQAITSRSKEASDSGTKSPNHTATLADLRGQISQLHSALATERQRKEACQKEIARLSKEVITSSEKHKPVFKTGQTSQTGSMVKLDKTGQFIEETDWSAEFTVNSKAENAELRQKLVESNEQHRTLLNTLKQKDNELIALRNILRQPSLRSGTGSVVTTPYHTPVHGIPLSTPAHISGDISSSETTNEHLLLVLRELQEREQTLKDCQEQLEQYRRKFAVIIHQQGVLYKEYQDAKSYWEEEREKMEREKEEMVVLQQQHQIKLEELQSLQEVLCNDPDTFKQKLGNLSRTVTKVRVNERSLSRRNTILQSNEARLRKEVTQLKQDMSEMETSVTQQLTYLRRYKDGASYKLSSLQQQLSHSVPRCQLDEANKQYTELASKCHGLVQQQVTSDSENVEEKVRLLSESLIESQAIEKELRMKIADTIDPSVQSQLESQVVSLERLLARLRQENSQLREKLEVTQEQMVMSQQRKEVKEKEMENLRKQILELSSQSDQKTLVGQLQQQILALQLSEHEALSQLQSVKSKVLSLEVQLLQVTQQSGEKEEEATRIRAQYIDRVQKLNTVLQTLHRRYIGATLLPDQVKFSLLLSQAKTNKELTQRKLEETEIEKEKAEEKVKELEVQQNNLQELISSLKEGHSAVAKVTEWHSKLGEMRLKELQYQRTISKLEEKLKHSQDIVSKSEHSISQLEHKLVQSTQEYEELLLSIEDGELMVPRKIISGRQEIAKTPVGERREVSSELDFSPAIAQLQSALQSTQLQCNQLDVSLRKAESQILEKDRTIHDLQLQLSSMEKRSILEEQTRDAHSSRALQIATDTIEQLQAQLTQKEGQVEKYQHLLQESRRETQCATEKHKQEIMLLEKKLENKSNIISRLQTSISCPSPSSLSTDQLARLHQFEDLTKELKESNASLYQQLETEKTERERERTHSAMREEGLKKEISQLKHKHRLEIKELQSSLSVKSEHVTELEQELEVLNGELSAALESKKKTPSRSLQDMVEKLRTQLTEKEQELKSLREALRQVRADLVNTAHKTLQSHTQQDVMEASVQKLVDERVRVVEEREEESLRQMRERMAQLEKELDNRNKKLKDMSSQHVQLEAELQQTQLEYEERGSLLERIESENRHLKKSLADAKSKEQRLNKEIRELQEELSTKTQKLDELQQRCEILQNKLEKKEQQLKELTQTNQAKAGVPMSLLDTKHSSVEVVRWEESKKWQRKVETLRKKLSEKNAEIETCQKYISSLKDTLARSDRDKEMIQEKLKATEKSKATTHVEATPMLGSHDGCVSAEEAFALKSQVFDLHNKVASLQQELQEHSTNEIEQLRAENKLLSDTNQALQEEKKHTSDDVSYGILAHENRLRDELLQSKKAYTQLQFQYEQTTLELPRLKARIEDLEQYIKVLKTASQSQGNSRQELSDKPGVYTAGEVEKVVSAMKKVIERLQSENESLKSKAKKLQRSGVEAENKRLKAELEKCHKSLAALGGTTSTDGEPSITAVISENEQLRHDIRKETEKSEKLHVNIMKLKSDKSRLEEELTKFSEPHEVLVRDRDRLKKENTKLKAELDSFDPQFFEEIEDLKYNYQLAVQKNVEYEEQLQHLSQQYGFTIPDLVIDETD